MDGMGNDTMDFCKGMFMTMSMSGFQSALFSGKRADCITFLFTDFQLDSPGKFVYAMLCTFFLAVLCEGMAHGQTRVRNHHLAGKSKSFRKLVMTLLYGFRQYLGWLLMLISMTFSIELFAGVILGIVVGKLLFPTETNHRQNRLEGDRNNPNGVDSSGQETGDGWMDAGELVPSQSSSSSSNGSSDNAVRRRRR